MDQMLTVAQAAPFFGGGIMRVYRRIHSGELKAVNIAPAGARKPMFMVAESAIRDYFAKRQMSIPQRRLSHAGGA